MAGGDFEDAWTLAEPVKGWMTREQGVALWHAASRLREGDVIVEIGSHHGRSTVLLGAAARQVGARVIAVDPFVDGRLFGGISSRHHFEVTIAAAELGDVVELVVDYSTNLRPDWRHRVDLLYIDGKHDYWTCSDDLLWSEHMPGGGEILVHDCFSSIGVTLSVGAKVLFGSRYTYVDRAGSLARFRLATPGRADRMRVVRQIPWFVRNVVVKVLLRLRLNVVAKRVMRHEGPYDPY